LVFYCAALKNAWSAITMATEKRNFQICYPFCLPDPHIFVKVVVFAIRARLEIQDFPF
jgi:hypothetical protein